MATCQNHPSQQYFQILARHIYALIFLLFLFSYLFVSLLCRFSDLGFQKNTQILSFQKDTEPLCNKHISCTTPLLSPPHIRFHFYSIIVIFTDSVLSPHYTSVSMLIFWNGTHGNLWVNNFYVEDIQVCQFIMHHSSNQGNLITSFTYTLNLHGECGTPKHAHIPL